MQTIFTNFSVKYFVYGTFNPSNCKGLRIFHFHFFVNILVIFCSLFRFHVYIFIQVCYNNFNRNSFKFYLVLEINNNHFVYLKEKFVI